MVSNCWLSIIGINENGVDGLSAQARELIASAELVVGGARHLELAGFCHPALVAGSGDKTTSDNCNSRPRNECGVATFAWANPIENTIKEILSYRNSRVAVLASGDPFCYGVGATLSRHIPIEEMLVIPAPSCFTLAASKLGWALQDTVTIGLNGRAIEKIIPYLQPKVKILALSTDETTPALLADLLNKRGFDKVKFWVLEHLGGKKEKVKEFGILDSAFKDIARLNMIALEIDEGSAGKIIPVSCGLADEFFENDGQLTKREVRAITLSSLAPRKGELLWDIGLGAGSVAIEWMLCDAQNRAIGFEKNPERAQRAKRNALALGAPDLKIIEGIAPQALEGVESPDAIFIGGGAGNPEVIAASWNSLKTGGRLVVNSVTLETESVVIAACKKYGGNIIRIGIERSEAVGTMTGLRPAMSVLQWSVVK